MKRLNVNSSRLAVVLPVLALLMSSLTFAQTPDRSAPPKPGPLPAFEVPELQRFELPNGLRVIFVQKQGVPLLHVSLTINAGSVDDAASYGLANMTAAMLDEGAGPYDAIQLADKIDFLGARISVSAGHHTTTVSLHTPISKLDQALPLMSMIVREPTFPKKELERLQKELLTEFLQWRDEPRAIAGYAFDRALYGAEHPYGHPVEGEPPTVSRLTRDDLVAFHRTFYGTENAGLVVVGDITKDALVPKLREAFGAWRRAKRYRQPTLPAEQVTSNMVYLIDKPGAAQSEIIIGRVGVDRLSDDYYEIQVMNTILGGSFTSRLNQNLREQHGYTYGARSGFSMRRSAGPFQASASVQTEVTDKALTEFMNEFRGILKPVPAEELARAKNYLALRFPENFQSVARIASQVDDIFAYGIPQTTFTEFMDEVRNVDAGGVLRVARDYVTPDAFVFIIVGDRQKIEPGIRALGLGPVTLRTVEEVLGPPPVIGDTPDPKGG